MKPTNKTLLIIIIIFSALLYLSFTFHNTLSPDEGYYAWQARQIYENPFGFLDAFGDYDVIVPGVIAVFDVFLPSEFAARLVGVLFGLLGVYLMYLLGKELKNKNLGLISALFLAINPWYWMLACRILLDVPLTVMGMLNVFLLVKFYKTKEIKFLIYSIIAFLGVLFTKSVGILFLTINIFMIIATYYPFKKINKRNLFVSIIVSMIAITIPFLLYFQNIIYFFKRYINFERIQGNYLVINNIYNILFGYIPDQLFLLFYLLTIIFIAFLIYLLIKKNKQRWIYLMLLMWIASVFGFRLFFGGHQIVRYVISGLPAIILLVVIVLYEAYELIKKKYKFKKLKKHIIILENYLILEIENYGIK